MALTPWNWRNHFVQVGGQFRRRAAKPNKRCRLHDDEYIARWCYFETSLGCLAVLNSFSQWPGRFENFSAEVEYITPLGMGFTWTNAWLNNKCCKRGSSSVGPRKFINPFTYTCCERWGAVWLQQNFACIILVECEKVTDDGVPDFLANDIDSDEEVIQYTLFAWNEVSPYFLLI